VCRRGARDRPLELVTIERHQHPPIWTIQPAGFVLYGTVAWSGRFDSLLQPDIDIVVELVGGIDPAREWVRRALLGEHGPEILSLARRQRFSDVLAIAAAWNSQKWGRTHFAVAATNSRLDRTRVAEI
jgi:hypothetical protein